MARVMLEQWHAVRVMVRQFWKITIFALFFTCPFQLGHILRVEQMCAAFAQPVHLAHSAGILAGRVVECVLRVISRTGGALGAMDAGQADMAHRVEGG